MANRSWRPDQIPEEKLARWGLSMAPGGLRGESPNPFGRATHSASLAQLTGASESDGDTIVHHAEILKAVGVNPTTDYQTTYLPTDFWPHVWAGGVPATPLVDYTVSGQTVSVTPALDLQANELLVCRYDYRGGVPLSIAGEPTKYAGSLIHLDYDYQFHYQLPFGTAYGDLMVHVFQSWHGRGNNSAQGWAQWYYTAGGDGRFAQGINAKFVDTEVAGDWVYPVTSGSGYRAAGVLLLIKGALPSDPLHDYQVNGAGLNVGSSSKMVFHAVAQGFGGADPTLSRGAEDAHQYDGLIGVRTSHETVAAGNTVSCTTNAGFVASIAINSAEG